MAKDIYNDRTYLTQNPTWNAEDAPFKTKKILQLLTRNPLDVKTVGEIGCGSGEILVQLEKSLPGYTRFFGFDISRDAMQIAKKKETSKITFCLMDITTPDKTREVTGGAPLPFFDLLLVIDVIEHVENYFALLDSLLSKGRFTIFHIPLDLSVWSLFREKMLIESKDRVGHIHNFTEDFIQAILADHGFRTVDKLYTEPTFETMPLKQQFVNAARKMLFKLNKRFCMKVMGGYSVLLLCENQNERPALPPQAPSP
jgi:SAM-dependent methyltransferase